MKKWNNTFLTLIPAFRRFSRHLKPDHPYIIIGFGVILGIAVTNTLMIWFIGSLFDQLQQGDFDALNHTALYFAVTVVINQGLHFTDTMLSEWIGLRFLGRMRSDFFNRLMKLSLPMTSQYPRGDLLTRLSDDAERVERLMVQAPFDMASHVCIFVFYVAMLFWIDFRLALLALAISPLFILHQRTFAPRKRDVSQKLFRKNGELVAFEESSLGNLRGIISFAVEPLIDKIHRTKFKNVYSWGMKDAKLNALFGASFSLLIYFSALAIILAGLNTVRSGEASLGHLVSFLLYLGYLSTPVRGFAQLYYDCQEGLASIDRILEIGDAEALVIEKPLAQPITISNGNIEFRNVTFAYPDGSTVFNQLNVSFEAGTSVALVGPSGRGKSTLATLLVRFYDPQEGQIVIDGQNIRDVSLNSLRSQVTVVWQEPFLINDTIRANLLLARPDAPNEDLIAACEASYAWEFIDRLENKLDTQLGPKGVSLSSGQQQRLAIAQAFLRDAPILVMDEPSSALDSHAEQQLVEGLTRLRDGRTTLIIAHRYSSIKAAHSVVYFNGDGSVSIGSHDELSKSHPDYRQAVQWQTTHANPHENTSPT